MKYVVLDTCVLVNCTLLDGGDADPELLVAISDRVRENGMKLLLPVVVEKEYHRKVPEKLGFIKQQTTKFRKEIGTKALSPRDVSALHQCLDRLDSERDSAATRSDEYFSRLADDEDLTVRVPLSGDILAEATTYVLAGVKPAKMGTKTLLDPDCLIVASIASYARSQNLSREDVILICSDNHTDFGLWSEDTKVHVISPDISAMIPCSVRYYKSPRMLLKGELNLDIQEGETIARALNEYDDYVGTLASATADLIKNISIPYYAQFLKNLGIDTNADLLKNISLPDVADLLKNISLPDVTDFFQNIPLPGYAEFLRNLAIPPVADFPLREGEATNPGDIDVMPEDEEPGGMDLVPEDEAEDAATDNGDEDTIL